MRDLKGTSIEVGCDVAYFRGGRYDSVNIAKVVAIKKKIKVEISRSSRGLDEPFETTWVDRDRVVVL